MLVSRLRTSCLGLTIGLLFAGLIGYALHTLPKAPEAKFTLLSGQSLSSTSLRGKVYGVHFWSIACNACLQEMPALIQLYERFHPQGLEWIAVAMEYDSVYYVQNYSQARHLPFPVMVDNGDLAKRFGHIALTPTTFIIDKKGKILKTYVGPLNFEALDKLLTQALT